MVKSPKRGLNVGWKHPTAQQKSGAVSLENLSEMLNVSRQYVHRKLKEMMEQNKVIKMGGAPHVFYSLALKNETQKSALVPYEKEQFLNHHFMLIDALGNQLIGLSAMKYFTSNQHLAEWTVLYDEIIKKFLKILGTMYFSMKFSS